MSEEIRSRISIAKIQTLVDGGVRWTLDAPETAIMQSAHLMEYKRAGVAIDVIFIPVFNDKQQDNEYGGRLK